MDQLHTAPVVLRLVSRLGRQFPLVLAVQEVENADRQEVDPVVGRGEKVISAL